MTRKIEISERTILFGILFPLGLFFLWTIRELLFSLLIAFILMSALRPIAAYLHRKRFPHTLSVFIVFIGFILFFASLVWIIIPPIVKETTILVQNFPMLVQRINPAIRNYVDLNSLSQVLPSVTNNIFSILGNVFSNLLFVITTLFFTLYFTLERDLVTKSLSPYMSPSRVKRTALIADKVSFRLSAWFWGEILLMTVIGLTTYIGLNLIGVRYALPLAVLAGLLEVVPNIGPIIAAIPSFIIGMSQSNLIGFSTLAMAFIIQQLENVVIVPLIMKRAVGLNPIMTLIALIIGGKIGGVLGVLLAIPLLLVIQTIVEEVWLKRRATE